MRSALERRLCIDAGHVDGDGHPGAGPQRSPGAGSDNACCRPDQAPMTNSASLDRPACLTVCAVRRGLPTLRGDRRWLSNPWRPPRRGVVVSLGKERGWPRPRWPALLRPGLSWLDRFPTCGRSNRCTPTRLVGLLGLMCIRAVVVSDRLARQFGDRTEGTLMPIHPSMLAKNIGTLTDLHPPTRPGQDLAGRRGGGQVALRR